MIVQTAIHYLESHKRLVVPQLGALIVKESDRSVVFTEMLKRDDGVLRSLLSEQGMSAIEAAGAIDRFVFEVRHAAEHGQTYSAEGLGLFSAGPNGTIRFRYSPSGIETTPDTTPGTQNKANNPTLPDNATHNPRTPQDGERPKEEAPASRLSPDPSVKGLRYGKPIHTTNPYTYVGAAKRRRPDKFVILALIAVLIAAGAILYGYLRERYIDRQERLYLEQTLERGASPQQTFDSAQPDQPL